VESFAVGQSGRTAAFPYSGAACEVYWLWLLPFPLKSRTAMRLLPSALTNESSRVLGFAMQKSIWRAVIEVALIIFLIYSNLLMGKFVRSAMGAKRGLAWAIGDVFTAANFEIAIGTAIVGYVCLEFLPFKLSRVLSTGSSCPSGSTLLTCTTPSPTEEYGPCLY